MTISITAPIQGASGAWARVDPSGRRANLARKSRPFRLNEKNGLSGSASPFEVSRWLRSRGHLPGLFVDRQIEHRQITRSPRDCSLVRIDQMCFGRSGGLAPTSLPLCQRTRFDAAGGPSLAVIRSLGEDDQHGLSANVFARRAASGY
jgi:hypothetical protein